MFASIDCKLATSFTFLKDSIQKQKTWASLLLFWKKIQEIPGFIGRTKSQDLPLTNSWKMRLGISINCLEYA